MAVNINTIDSSYTRDTITYNDSHIDTIISDLNSVISKLNSISSHIETMENLDVKWKGEAKTQYNELKKFMKTYKTDYKKSVKSLKSAVSGLKTLLGSISDSNVIKEIDQA